MRTLPRLRSLSDWDNTYPITLEDWSDSIAYQNRLIARLSNAICKATDRGLIRYLNNALDVEQHTFYAMKQRFHAN